MKSTVVLKTTATSVAAIVASTAAVNAQNVWEGFYAGLAVSSYSGDMGDSSVGSGSGGDYNYSAGRGAKFSIFGGHNWAVGSTGNTIVGFEIATGGGPSSSNDYIRVGLENVTDFKLRAGQSFGKTLVYGFAGVSTGALKVNGTGGGSNSVKFNSTGGLVGIGAAYAATDRFSVGLEYTHRSMGGFDYGSSSSDIKLNSIGLRGTFNF